MTSASTCPGPTEGNWSISPTIRRAAWSGTAFRSACMRETSTIELSSTTRRSHSSGDSSFRLKPNDFGSISSKRWMVFASMPVASFIRLAARPVGAHSKQLDGFCRQDLQDRVDDGGFADARSTGDHHDLGAKRETNGLSLGLSKCQSSLLLDPGDCLVRHQCRAMEADLRSDAGTGRRHLSPRDKARLGRRRVYRRRCQR